MTKRVPVVVVGGGPAGLCAALAVTAHGHRCLLIDRQDVLGGQLIKQTHRFFGSRTEGAGRRGMDIGRELAAELTERPLAEVWLGSSAAGYYQEDGTLLVERPGSLVLVHPERLVLATGAAERSLAFAGNDLPGVYGAGAVQTLMNVHGIRPGRRALMVGAGNIGLIVAYQLLQAGVQVAAVVEAAPAVGGYWVHAAKLARAGVPILTGHSIAAALGQTEVSGARIVRLDRNWLPVPGSEVEVACDVICLAVGLSPLTELALLAGCHVPYVAELGGYVPWHDEEMRTDQPRVYVAGDGAGVEEASAAMLEGTIAGLAVANSLAPVAGYAQASGAARQHLTELRGGPSGAKIRLGLARLTASSRAGGSRAG